MQMYDKNNRITKSEYNRATNAQAAHLTIYFAQTRIEHKIFFVVKLTVYLVEYFVSILKHRTDNS